MSHRTLDRESVQQKLETISELATALDETRGVTLDDLIDDDVLRRSTLWLLTQLVTVAASVAAHVVTSQTGRAPADYASGFEGLGQLGIVDGELVTSLKGATGMRNVLVHQYDDIDLEVVAAAVGLAADAFTRLVEQVAVWLIDHDG